VRDVPDVNGRVFQSPGSAVCTLTSENVTSSAFASLNGLSVSRIDIVPVAFEVPPPDVPPLDEFEVGVLGVLLPEHANAAATVAIATPDQNNLDERMSGSWGIRSSKGRSREQFMQAIDT
jgi:hypothetical protein